MTPWLDDGDQRLYHGDCVQVMPGLGAVDAVVTDPPYGLGFMGKDWDSPGGTGDFPMRRTTEANTVNTGVTRQGGRQRSCSDFARRQARDARSFQEWCESWAVVALDVLKPGGHIVAFGGTRTYHRLACALEDAGFEIRDCLMWLYGSGFPKSLDVSKAIDKAAGAERDRKAPQSRANPSNSIHANGFGADGWSPQVDAAVTAAAAAAAGLGTALKPAWEPIILARKPLTGTVAKNVSEYGTGALNIDACRIAGDGWQKRDGDSGAGFRTGKFMGVVGIGEPTQIGGDRSSELGRWPANVALDEAAAAMLDQQSGHLPGPANRTSSPRRGYDATSYAVGTTGDRLDALVDHEGGGASRFFYTAKASRSERNDGIHSLEPRFTATMGNGIGEREHDPANPRAHTANHHPTVKPIALMRWLVRLVTPPGGVVLDPFVGSGSTLVACRAEGVRGVGIDREADYLRIAAGRLSQLSLLGGTA